MTIRRFWRYQRGNQNPYMEEEQTTQCLNFKESIISNLNHLVCIIVIMIAYNGGRSDQTTDYEISMCCFYIYRFKKNQHKNGNDVLDSQLPHCHTIANVLYSCNHQNNKRSWPTISNTILQNTEPPKRILHFSNPNLPAVLISVPTLEAFKMELAHV
jgi:hypothetical protein